MILSVCALSSQVLDIVGNDTSNRGEGGYNQESKSGYTRDYQRRLNLLLHTLGNRRSRVRRPVTHRTLKRVSESNHKCMSSSSTDVIARTSLRSGTSRLQDSMLDVWREGIFVSRDRIGGGTHARTSTSTVDTYNDGTRSDFYWPRSA